MSARVSGASPDPFERTTPAASRLTLLAVDRRGHGILHLGAWVCCPVLYGAPFPDTGVFPVTGQVSTCSDAMCGILTCLGATLQPVNVDTLLMMAYCARKAQCVEIWHLCTAVTGLPSVASARFTLMSRRAIRCFAKRPINFPPRTMSPVYIHDRVAGGCARTVSFFNAFEGRFL